MLVALTICLLSVGSVASKRCLECVDMPHPQTCLTSTTCSSGQVCYVQQFVSSGGLVLYNSGCRSIARCPSAGQSTLLGHRKRRDIAGFTSLIVGKQMNSTDDETTRNDRQDRSGSDIISCDQCCDQDFCNNKGCGTTALQQPARAPICFNCPMELDPEQCRDLTQCDPGEQCAIQENTNIQWPTKLYKSGCASDMQCRGLITTSSLVGKRSATASKHCSLCCHDDYCNHSCNRSIAMATTTVSFSSQPLATSSRPAFSTKKTDSPTTIQNTKTSTQPTSSTPKTDTPFTQAVSTKTKHTTTSFSTNKLTTSSPLGFFSAQTTSRMASGYLHPLGITSPKTVTIPIASTTQFSSSASTSRSTLSATPTMASANSTHISSTHTKSPTTVALVSTTMPPQTTTPPHCKRDIVFVVDKSKHSDPHISLQLIRNVVGHLQIGSHANLVALTFFDEHPSKQWHLTDFGNKNDLLNAISKVNPSKSHDSNKDLDEMAEWVVETALDNHHGDRKGFPNDVIIITAASNEYDDDHHLLRRIHHASGDVILVEVGTGSNNVDADKRIEQLATNSGHVIKVPSYSQLPRITTHLLKLLCS